MEYKKAIYYYLDEAGGIDNDSNIFIHGCIRTDTPDSLEKQLSDLLDSIKDNIYYSSTVEKILNQGFHAVENHFDVRADLFKILPLLNFRAYFVLLNKKDEYFESLSKKMDASDIYEFTLQRLLRNRLLESLNYNFFFEELQLPKSSQKKILDDFFKTYLNDKEITYRIVGKKETQNTSIIDYMNYLIYQLLNYTKVEQRMVENFELLKPKIALIDIVNTNSYFSRNKKFNLLDLQRLLVGSQ